MDNQELFWKDIPFSSSSLGTQAPKGGGVVSRIWTLAGARFVHVYHAFDPLH